jgi:hypothetical protein
VTRRRAVAIILAVVVLAVAAVAAAVWWIGEATKEQPASPQAQAPAAQTPAPTSPASPTTPTSPTTPSNAASRSRSCAAGVARSYVPTSIKVAGMSRARSVIAPLRDARGVPGVPPLTTAGKQVFAWDPEQGIRPGDPHGNVLLNAHTWPDGSALGNELLDTLEQGDRIVVRGKDASLCYRVTERMEVSAAAGLPRYYATDGPPQLAIVVCSGRRLGPGAWENRTIWFASPTA